MIDSSEEDYFNDKTNDPTLANGKAANIYKDLLEIQNKGNSLKELCKDLIDKNYSKIKTTFKNYVDLLHKLKSEEGK